MSDYTFVQAEALIISQRKIIESMRESLALKDLLIESLQRKIKEKEEEEKVV